jgi:glycerophosphoryl diester phosphodiesterase
MFSAHALVGRTLGRQKARLDPYVLLLPESSDGKLDAISPVVNDAHDAGLVVHAWTFRAENHFLTKNLRSSGAESSLGRLEEEIAAFLRAGVDGIFTDHPDFGVRARQTLL